MTEKKSNTPNSAEKVEEKSTAETAKKADKKPEIAAKSEKVEKKDNISVTRDTIIKTLHDTIIQLDTKIVEINKNNEEIRNTIINQSVDSDCVFFAEYLQISESNK